MEGLLNASTPRAHDNVPRRLSGLHSPCHVRAPAAWRRSLSKQAVASARLPPRQTHRFTPGERSGSTQGAPLCHRRTRSTRSVSTGSPGRQRSPSPGESIRDAGSSTASAHSGDAARSRSRPPRPRGCQARIPQIVEAAQHVVMPERRIREAQPPSVDHRPGSQRTEHAPREQVLFASAARPGHRRRFPPRPLIIGQPFEHINGRMKRRAPAAAVPFSTPATKRA